MYSKLKAEWQTLRRGRPGHRFEGRYLAARKASRQQTLVARVVRLALAVVALAIGVVLVFVPGPAILFFIIAGGLFATESRGVARVLDWAELKVRSASKWSLAVWRKLSPAAKVAVALIILAVVAAAGFAAYRWFFA